MLLLHRLFAYNYRNLILFLAIIISAIHLLPFLYTPVQPEVLFFRILLFFIRESGTVSARLPSAGSGGRGTELSSRGHPQGFKNGGGAAVGAVPGRVPPGAGGARRRAARAAPYALRPARSCL